MKAIKVKMYPNKRQKEVIEKTFGCTRFVYNWALDRKIKHYQSEKKSLGKYTLMNEIVALKNDPKTEWLNEVPSQALQQAVMDLDSAFNRFFKRTSKFPRFKSKRDDRKSYRNPAGFEIAKDEKAVKLPKLGWVKFRDKFNVSDFVEYRSVTVSREGTDYFASILYDDHIPVPSLLEIEKDKTLGIDLGVKTLATFSDGTKVENPKNANKYQEKLAYEQRKLASKDKTKKSYQKQKERVRRVHKKVSDSRKDFLNKLTTGLVENQDYTSFCIEDLAVKDMLENNPSSKISKAIGDVGFRMFRTMMEQKCLSRGKNLIIIGRFEPSSKMCSCGEINHSLGIEDREWDCRFCGSKHDRDVLAASNIKQFGLRKSLGKDFS